MAESNSPSDPIDALLSEVRGDTQAFDAERWSSWSSTLGEWVEAYPAFGAGRLLRAKASRDGRHMKAADHLVEAAVFASVPGRLFDLLFRAGIESEIATFARAVEALEPELEEELRLRWNPEPVEPKPDPEGQKPSAEGEEAEEAEERIAVEVPPEGSLAREVVLGAIERSIEQEIEAVRAAEAPNPEPVVEEAPAAAEPKPEGSGVDVANLSPLARWAYERSQQTGFVESAIAGTPALRVEQAAEHVEEVLSSDAVPSGEEPQGRLEQQAALIDLFIRNEPVISPIQPDVERPAIKELAKESLVEDTSLITETMARIYAAQGQLGRARRAYKLLALKYPEKSVYFAAQSKTLGRKSEDD
ncbi:MAG: hypothetical protein VXY61_06825 [Bacteroidota bacterium]|nr:hypothetical protein [Bacteroidota bacterium]